MIAFSSLLPRMMLLSYLLFLALVIAPPRLDAQDQTEISQYFFEYRVPRLALVIGNRDYFSDCVDPAHNAENDANVIANKLSSPDFAFDTVVLRNATYSEMWAKVQDLSRTRIPQATLRGVRPLVLVYYSGHGFNINGRAYIAGRDVSVDNPADRSLPVDQILEDISRNATLVLLLDACRSDVSSPMDSQTTACSSVQRTAAVVLGAGIVGSESVAPPRVAVSRGHTFLIGYAVLRLGDAALNSVRSSDANSPYTVGLQKYLGDRGEDIREEMLRVKSFVQSLTSHRQEPTTAGDVGRIYLRPTPLKADEMKQRWFEVLKGRDPEEIEFYLANFPESPFSAAAAAWLEDRRRSPTSKEYPVGVRK